MIWNALTNGASFEPWRSLADMHAQMDRLFSQFARTGTGEFPPVELWTGPDGIRMEVQIPGVTAEDVELTVVGDTVTVKGSRPASGGSESENPHRKERESGRFVRTIQLPFAVDSERVAARFEHGLLDVELPRLASDKPRKITVKSA